MTTKGAVSFFLKNPALWSIKIRINNTLFDAQNAGNRISELLDFKFFWGSMPQKNLKSRSSEMRFPAFWASKSVLLMRIFIDHKAGFF